MICSAINDRNIVDDSVKNIINSVPNIVTKAYSIFVKYGKLIDQKYYELSQSDERRRIKNVNDVKNLLSLTFDKILFALDRDLYIDFMNEIKQINSNEYFWNPNYESKTVERDIHNLNLNSISLKYLVHPSTPLRVLSNSTYDLKSVPLIKIEPQFNLVKADYKGYIGYYADFDNEDANKYGIGIEAKQCNAYIDITSLFEIFRRNLYDMRNRFNNNECPHSSCKDYSDFHILNCEESTYIGNPNSEFFQENIINPVYNSIIYSMTTSYLALLGKLTQAKESGNVETIFNDILDSCRKTVLGNYDLSGNEAKTGMGLRHMMVDISTLFNALSDGEFKSEAQSNETNLLRQMIEYAFNIRYSVFNYIAIPMDNLKHKKLIGIDKVAKPQVSFLNADTRAELQLCCVKYKPVTRNTNIGNKVDFTKFFCDKSDIKVDGTYAFNKRLYDITKDFIDVFAKMIIIKKRAYYAGGLNSSDGTVDPIGKRYIDYRSYMKKSFDELKMTLANITTRIKSVTIGRRYLTSNIGVKDANEGVIKNLNTIVFGINTESAIDESYYGSELNSLYDTYKSVDYNRDKWCYHINNRISDIRNIYAVLKERECTYKENSTDLLETVNSLSNASLIAFWIGVTECIGDFFDSPYKYMINNIVNVSMNFGESSINEMSPKGELFLSSSQNDIFKDWNGTENVSHLSIEELDSKVQELKEKLDENDSESIFGGLLFGDFGGVPLAQEMTAKETEIMNDQLSVHTINPEDVESFESIKEEFDTLLAKYL